MNHYEMVSVIDVKWAEGNTAKAEELVKAELLKTGGELEGMKDLGSRKLAYPIQNHKEGLYLLTYFTHPPEGIGNLRNNIKLSQPIIRCLIVRTKASPPIELDEKEAEPRPEAELGAEPRPEAEPGAEPRPEAKPEPEAEPRPEAEPGMEPRPEPKPEPEAEPRPEAEPGVEPSPPPTPERAEGESAESEFRGSPDSKEKVED